MLQRRRFPSTGLQQLDRADQIRLVLGRKARRRIGIFSEQSIIQIGPGIGVLTKELLAKTPNVTAIELDERMTPLLKHYITTNKQQVTSNKFTIIQGNALHTPMPKESYKIVANIPYHITSPLLRHIFLESPVTPKTMTLLIQREVAEKICDVKKAGMLTIIVGLFGTAKIVTHVPPRAFLPPPNVESSVLHIDCFEKPKAEPAIIDRIFTLTKIGFGQRRKMLRKSIGTLPNGMAMLKQCGIDSTRRPETLSVDEWIALAHFAALTTGRSVENSNAKYCEE